MVKIKKNKTTKTDPKKLRELVVDEDLLEQRRQNNQSQKKKIPLDLLQSYKPYTKWNNMQADKFIIREYESKFYGHYEEWGDRIWIGPYDNEEELNKVIMSYVKETKKDPLKRNINNIHSILIDLI